DTMTRRAAAFDRNRRDASNDDPPDPMLTKGQAYLAYLAGDVEVAVQLLKATAAASDTISKRAIERGATEVEESVSAAPRVTSGVGPLGAPVDGAPVDDDWDDDSTAERAR